MRRLIAFLLAVFLLVAICSCELSYQAPEIGKMHILVYGNDYSYGNKVVSVSGETIEGFSASPLYKTVNDALQVGKALSALAGKAGLDYEACYLIGRETVSVTDAKSVFKNDVTKAALESEIGSIAASSSECDITVIYYSGHGHGVNSRLDYGSDTSASSYLVPRQSSASDSSILFQVSEFLQLVESIDGVKIIIGDFCHSGSLVQSNYFSVTSGEYLQMDVSDLFAKYRNVICINPSLFCLSASRYNELSYEIPDKDKYGNPLPNSPKHGYFTYALLEALGWDEDNQCLKTAAAEKNNRITLSAIAEYVVSHDEESKQTPMVSGGSNDIVLFSF